MFLAPVSPLAALTISARARTTSLVPDLDERRLEICGAWPGLCCAHARYARGGVPRQPAPPSAGEIKGLLPLEKPQAASHRV